MISARLEESLSSGFIDGLCVDICCDVRLMAVPIVERLFSILGGDAEECLTNTIWAEQGVRYLVLGEAQPVSAGL
jgi:hypothetical protein